MTLNYIKACVLINNWVKWIKLSVSYVVKYTFGVTPACYTSNSTSARPTASLFSHQARHLASPPFPGSAQILLIILEKTVWKVVALVVSAPLMSAMIAVHSQCMICDYYYITNRCFFGSPTLGYVESICFRRCFFTLSPILRHSLRRNIPLFSNTTVFLLIFGVFLEIVIFIF